MASAFTRADLKELPHLSLMVCGEGSGYYDASMWDDAMVTEILRFAQIAGAYCANYVEAVSPLWTPRPSG